MVSSLKRLLGIEDNAAIKVTPAADRAPVLGAAAMGILEKLEADGHLAEGNFGDFALLTAVAYDEAGAAANEAASIADATHAAFSFIGEKPAKAHKIRTWPLMLQAVDATVAAEPVATVLEILNDDMPFLVDSVMGEIQARGFSTRLMVHPTFKATRDAAGQLSAITARGDRNWRDHQESFIQVQLDPLTEADAAALVSEISVILDNVRQVVSDWQPMLARIRQAITSYEGRLEATPDAALSEAVAFLEWLEKGNFTVLGVQELDLTGGADDGDLVPRAERGLGILRDPSVSVLRRGNEMVHMTPEVRRFFFQPEPLIVTKANVVSKIHRRVHMDYIGVKILGPGGEIAGELRIVGLFTAGAYTQSVARIPLLRRKAEIVVARSGFAPDSHSANALVNVLETFPRDELFQIPVDQLHDWAVGIHGLDLRPRTAVFSRIDEFDRFVSLLVFVPRDRYTTEVRQRVGDFFAEAFRGRLSAFFPYFQRGPLVRIQFIIGRYHGDTPRHSQAYLEQNVIEIVTTWQDRFTGALTSRMGRGPAAALLGKYGEAFPAGYSETFPAGRALEDIARIEPLTDAQPVGVDFYHAEGSPAHQIHVALYRFDQPIPLSRRVPVFENFGFSVIDERSFRLMPKINDQTRTVMLHDMLLETDDGQPIDLKEMERKLEDCFLAIWRGDAEDDNFNRLIRVAGADWREAAMMRSYGSYLRQIRVPFGLRYLGETLARHADVARRLIAMFSERFDPARLGDAVERDAAVTALKRQIEAALGDIPSLDEDRILRHFLNLVQATLRTNFFQTTQAGTAPGAISFKFRSRDVEELPSPKPLAEIYVYSPRVEGIHLRFAEIARGGLRWSDRQQDYRTEVLGLVKAQQVKNAVIVPAGAKGGFFPKQLPRMGSRDELFREGTEAYKIFVSNLLDITDNLVGADIVPPSNVVRKDGDDPYLVVAADKGTATFSDTANGLAEAHGFWMGDAFASGGSAGYDHKKMGITARGGWESVKRLFREMNRDIQNEPFTAIGVGDMSGDVFGNGMLLSQQTCLLAAFDHRDIFIDPAPDAATSFVERKRLFELGRSSWQDYDKALISRGGGIFPRSSKSITLTPEIQALTGIEADKVPPAVLMKALLQAPADLLWFGGIGTYIRSGSETDDAVGDRANDNIRITGSEIRARVIGEGANLGVTQRGRIEFALAGGRINTDFIDNSAGVNSSDLEVNIKIALRPAVTSGRLEMPARNELLASMTEEVAASCLRNNYLQSLAISLGESRGLADLGFQQRLMRDQEGKGLLDRSLEYLPGDVEIANRFASGQPLTRPELAVLLCYAKIDLYQKLLASNVPDDPYFDRTLLEYFPRTLRENYQADIEQHRLRREIIATALTNSIINRGGSTVVVRLEEETGHGAADTVRSFAAVRDVFALDRLWPQIDALDNQVAGATQLALYRRTQDLVRRETAWFLRHGRFSGGVGEVVGAYRDGIAQLRGELPAALADRQRARAEIMVTELVGNSVPPDLAQEFATLEFLADGTDITAAAIETGQPIADVAKIFFAVGAEFRLSELRAAAESLAVADYFDRLAINSTLAIVSDAHRSITQNVVRQAGEGKGDLAAWRQRNGVAVARVRSSLSEILDGGALTLARLTVAASHVRELALL